MARKRAPGGGRKPLGEFKGKTVTITTRVTPETRTGLERRAKEHNRSLSQEIERALREWVYQDRGHAHVRGLAHAITLLIRRMEGETQSRWSDDPFTCEAVRHGIETLLLHFAPQGAPVTPSNVAAASARMPDQSSETYRTPPGFAERKASDLVALIEAVPELPKKSWPGVHFPEEWYTYSQIRDDIGSASAQRLGHRKSKTQGG
jgi:hypothetical protein